MRHKLTDFGNQSQVSTVNRECSIFLQDQTSLLLCRKLVKIRDAFCLFVDYAPIRKRILKATVCASHNSLMKRQQFYIPLEELKKPEMQFPQEFNFN